MLGEELQMGIDRTISNQADSVIYLINEHSQYETPNLPIDQNILDFSQRQMDFKFKVTLFCDSEDCKNLSKELKSKLVIYYIFYTGALAIKLMSEILFSSEYTVPWSHMLFHILSCACLFCISMVILFFVCISGVALTFNRELYTLLSVLTIIYYCLGEESILSGITSDSYDHQFPNGVIYIVALISVTKALIFNCFKYVTFLSVFGSLFYLIIGLIFTKASSYTIVCDFLIMLLLLSLQTFDAHQVDYRTRQLFYRKIQEEEALMPITSYANRGVRTINNVNSEVEQIVKCCDHIKSHIKSAAKIIMFNDVKKNLKEAANEIEKIKRRVAHGSFLADIKIEPSYEIDEEDRVFLTQMFSELKTPTPRRSRRPSIQQMLERINNFPFANYGAAELENVLTGMGKNWSFDIWFVYNATGHSIIIVADYLFQKWGLKNEFRIKDETIQNYFKSLEQTYKPVPYHNACHAADVLHTIMYFITQSEQGFSSLCALDTIAIFVAALGHDVGHPAVTNRFLANNRDELAIKYNDCSVLEMMHCSITFEIMTYHDHDIFLHLSNEEWFKARKMIVEMILQTDMSKHFEFLGKFKTRAISLCDISLENDDDKNFILSMALKCADLGHAAKYQELHEKWTSFICEEFFRQGDMERERKQPISVYCDRNDTNVPKSQVGFLKNVAFPLYEAWCTYLNEDTIKQVCLEQIKMNIAFWESKCIDRRNTMIIIGKDKDSPKNPAIVKRHSNFYIADFNPKSKL